MTKGHVQHLQAGLGRFVFLFYDPIDHHFRMGYGIWDLLPSWYYNSFH